MARLSYIVLIIATNALICVLAEELYSNRYDHLDVRTLLQNAELREAYYKCFMELAPCTTLAQQRLTAVFSEAYQTKCRRCTQKQIENMNLVTDWFVTNEPKKWRLIVEKTINDLKKKYADQ
ncbi:ejaculatory bulb-specific protein 3-like [Temnothorax americanus]|uniref:ejaculatory bulb-specific protein 3-like n=1 Tax=Temnothorax americanus TaxID=1964332 RepID=UPI0040688F75